MWDALYKKIEGRGGRRRDEGIEVETAQLEKVGSARPAVCHDAGGQNPCQYFSLVAVISAQRRLAAEAEPLVETLEKEKVGFLAACITWLAIRKSFEAFGAF